MRKEWIVTVYGESQIYFYNSIGGESGPWAWDSAKGAISDLAGAYEAKEVSDGLGARLDEALTNGTLPVDLPYSPDDLKDD